LVNDSISEAVNDVRVEIYRSFIEERRSPDAAEIAEKLGFRSEDVKAALKQLHDDGVIALYPGSYSVWLAHPFSGALEPFKVRTGAGEWDSVCVWDALGILALLECDGDLVTACPDCGEALTLSVGDGELASTDEVVHFGVPAARWYEDIAYT
jgi:hypothetical protein